MNTCHITLHSPRGAIVTDGNNAAYDAFHANTSHRALYTAAGNGSNAAKITGTSADTQSPTSGNATEGIPANRYKCSRSGTSIRNVRATASNTCALALIGRPCSNHVYQVTPTPASCATSSRRKPGVRRRDPTGNPTSAGPIRSRRDRKNADNSPRRTACPDPEPTAEPAAAPRSPALIPAILTHPGPRIQVPPIPG